MLTLIHAPNTRSTRIVVLIDEMKLWDKIEIRTISVINNDGTPCARSVQPTSRRQGARADP